MEALKPVHQHRAITIREHLRIDFNNEVGPDPKHMPIERSMVQLAQRQTIGDGGLATFGISDDVGSVE